VCMQHAVVSTLQKYIQYLNIKTVYASEKHKNDVTIFKKAIAIDCPVTLTLHFLIVFCFSTSFISITFDHFVLIVNNNTVKIQLP